MSATVAASRPSAGTARTGTNRRGISGGAPLAAGLCCLLAFLLRLIGAATAGLDGDEAFSAEMALRPLPEMLAGLAGGEPHPPLFYAGLGLWTSLAGTSELALRVPAIAAGTLLVAILYQAGTQIGGTRLGLIAAAVVGLNAYQVWYAQEARMYVPAALLAALGLTAAIRGLNSGRIGWYAGAAAGLLLAALTHYYAVFPAAAIAAITGGILVGGGRRREAGWWAACLGLAALAYLPWLIYAGRIIGTHQLAPAGTVDFGHVLVEAARRYTTGPPAPAAPWTGLPAAAGWLLIAMVGSAVLLRRRPAPTAIVLGSLLAPIALGAAVSLARPMFEARYFMVAAPAFYLLIAAGLWGMLEWRRPIGILAIAVAAVALALPLAGHLRDPGRKSDFKAAAEAILRDLRHGDAVVLAGRSQEPQFWYYVRHRGANLVPAYTFPQPNRPIEPGLTDVLDRHTGVWLLDYDVGAFDPDRRVERFLAENASLALTRRPATSRVNYYATSGAYDVADADPLPYQLLSPSGDPVLHVAAARLTAERVAPGDVAPIDLAWRVLRPPGVDLAFSRRLIDGAGRVVWQRDGRPIGGFRPTTAWETAETVTDRAALVVPDYLPPGEYRLTVIAYPAAGGDAATVAPPVPGNQIPLGTLVVADGRAINRLADLPLPPIVGPALGGLRLIGARPPAGDLRPGAPADLELLWSLDGPAPVDARAQVILPDGTRLADLAVGPAGYPPDRWPPGRRVLQTAPLTLPPTLESGRSRLSLRLIDAAGAASPPVPIGEVAIVARPRVSDPPPFDRPTGVEFGGFVRLAGHSLTKPAGAGPGLRLRLVWQAIATPDRGYQLFIHLVDKEGRIAAQRDLPPGGDAAPTAGWLLGEYVTTEVDLAAPVGLPAGEYRILIGLYDPATGQRLAIAGGADHFELTGIDLP